MYICVYVYVCMCVCACMLRTRLVQLYNDHISNVVNKDIRNLASASVNTMAVHTRPKPTHII